MLLSTYLHRVKETKSIENGAPGPWEGLQGRSANCGYDLFAQCVRLRSELTIMRPITLVQLGARYLRRLFNQRIKFVQNGNGLSVDGVQMKRRHAKGRLIFK